MIEYTLPDKPSELIKLALKDLEKCENDERFEINMYEWYKENYKCQVCLAGAIIAQEFKEYIGTSVCQPNYFPNTICAKLHALNFFRCGEIRNGLKQLGIESYNISDIFMSEYEEDSIQFKNDLLLIILKLEEKDL